MRLRILGVVALVACVALLSSSAWADSIAVQNASFEQTNALTPNNCGGGCSINSGPVPLWLTTGIEAGSWQPGTSGIYFLPNAVPDGNTIAYVVNASLSQDLGVGLQPNETYTLTVDAGDRLDGFLSGNYTIALDVNGVAMCSFTGNNASITPGTFSPETCSFTTLGTVPSGDLSIVLSDFSGEATFDDVTVTTPEPASVTLLGLGLLSLALVGGLYKRKRGFQNIT